MAACIFCKIIKGEIPSMKLFESEKTLAFLDIGPLSYGHSLIIPKYHGAKLTDIPDDQLSEIMTVTKKIASASGAENYNILQNNGRAAHQEVDHVHFHMIPKPNAEEGLVIGWPAKKGDMERLKSLCEEIKAKM
ncbi:HIT-like protein [Rhizodiscina lignyota]|uniref:Adenosine 5'-monophosphoramidase HNT1 n=1 Tax=Rhizodiscina lignyota TaxID=1504668 RepID=A0A9P4IBT3_9PEZI|nr:HIT-like protein [Rhizodiscina lignyota]